MYCIAGLCMIIRDNLGESEIDFIDLQKDVRVISRI
jgi:hypothetical protein